MSALVLAAAFAAIVWFYIRAIRAHPKCKPMPARAYLRWCEALNFVAWLRQQPLQLSKPEDWQLTRLRYQLMAEYRIGLSINKPDNFRITVIDS